MTIEALRAELKASLIRLKEKSEYADICEECYDLEPEDANNEKAFDEAYKAEHEEREHAIAILVKLIGCDSKIARKMIVTQSEAIMAIV